jgi:hypothetical protein
MAVQVVIYLMAKSSNGQIGLGTEYYDISNCLVNEGDIRIDKRVEFNGVFRMGVSNVDLAFKSDGTTAFSTWLRYDFLKINYYPGIQIIKDGVEKFWGYVDRESVEWDEIAEDVVRFTVVNWYKYFEDLDDVIIPELSTYTISSFFSAVLGSVVITGVDMHIGTISELLDIADYQSLRSNGMIVKDFILELQKHTGAFIYFSPDKRLKLINRGKFVSEEAVNILNDIVEEAGESRDYRTQEVTVNKYDSLLMSAKGNWEETSPGVWIHWEGWVMVNYNGTAYPLIYVNEDLSNIPSYVRYLDVRQKLTWDGSSFGFSYTYFLFNNRDAEDRFNDYKTVLKPAKKKFLTVNRTDLDLFAEVNLGGSETYSVLRLEESLDAEVTELELELIPADE